MSDGNKNKQAYVDHADWCNCTYCHRPVEAEFVANMNRLHQGVSWTPVYTVAQNGVMIVAATSTLGSTEFTVEQWESLPVDESTQIKKLIKGVVWSLKSAFNDEGKIRITAFDPEGKVTWFSTWTWHFEEDFDD